MILTLLTVFVFSVSALWYVVCFMGVLFLPPHIRMIFLRSIRS